MPTPLTTSSERLPKKTRLLSLDALRGFDMFWIISGERIFHGIANAIQSKHALQLSMPETWLIGISNQLKHSARDAVFLSIKDCGRVLLYFVYSFYCYAFYISENYF